MRNVNVRQKGFECKVDKSFILTMRNVNGQTAMLVDEETGVLY